MSACFGSWIHICGVLGPSDTDKQTFTRLVLLGQAAKVCFTWMRHLLTSLAQRALLQPEVRARPDRRKRRAAAAAAAAAGRVVLILTAHQHLTGNSWSTRQHQHGGRGPANGAPKGGSTPLWKHKHSKTSLCPVASAFMVQISSDLLTNKPKTCHGCDQPHLRQHPAPCNKLPF